MGGCAAHSIHGECLKPPWAFLTIHATDKWEASFLPLSPVRIALWSIVSPFAICQVEWCDKLMCCMKNDLKIVHVKESLVLPVACLSVSSTCVAVGYCVVSFVFVGAQVWQRVNTVYLHSACCGHLTMSTLTFLHHNKLSPSYDPDVLWGVCFLLFCSVFDTT